MEALGLATAIRHDEVILITSYTQLNLDAQTLLVTQLYIQMLEFLRDYVHV